MRSDLARRCEMAKKGRLQQSYDEKFKVEAVGLVTKQGMKPSKVSDDLGIPRKTMYQWLEANRRGKLVPPPGLLNGGQVIEGKPQASKAFLLSKLTDEQRRSKDLEAKLHRMTMERDILKKAMAYCMESPK
jgi:transposase